MEYPGAKFTHPLRFAMLLLFIAAFFVIAPTVILYSGGYRYDFKNGLLRETGSLSVDIVPTTASISLDGLSLTDSMPIRLNNLTPHRYTFEITAPGYYSWKKEIEINKNQTTYIKEMILLKKSTPEFLAKGIITTASVSLNERYLAYIEQQPDSNSSLCYLRDLATNVTTLAARLPTAGALRLTWNKKANYAAVSSLAAPYTILQVIDAEHPTTPQNISAMNPEPITKFMWRAASEPELYYSTASAIHSYLPTSELSRQIAENTFLDWYNENGTLWALTYSTTTNRLSISSDLLGFTNTFATIDNPGFTTTSTTPTGWQLLAIQGSSALLHNGTANNFLLARSDKQYSLAADTFYISPYNNWWLLSSPWELWTYTDGGEPSLLNRSDTKLTAITPLDEYNTLAIATEKDVTVLYPYYYIEQVLVTKNVRTLAPDISRRTLYYSTSDGLWRLTY